MDYRPLGRSGLKVSPLCLGTMMFGGPTDEATSGRIIARACEAGINFIDTADAYNNGRSEQVVGSAISSERSWWIWRQSWQTRLAILLPSALILRQKTKPWWIGSWCRLRR